jgi:hypothetical protein
MFFFFSTSYNFLDLLMVGTFTANLDELLLTNPFLRFIPFKYLLTTFALVPLSFAVMFQTVSEGGDTCWRLLELRVSGPF